MAPQEQGLQLSVTIPSPSPDLRASSSTRGTRPDSRQLGVREDGGGSTGEGGDGGLTSQGVSGTTGSGTSHYQVPLWAVSCPGGVTAFSGRCSDRRSCVGTVVPMPRQTSLSLIPAEGFDNNTVCRQGNPKCGVPPGKTLCWAWARAADTCEQVNSTVCRHRPSALRLGSQHLIKREKKTRRDLPATSSATVTSPHLPPAFWEGVEVINPQ